MSNSYFHTLFKQLSIYRTRASTHGGRKIGYQLGLFENSINAELNISQELVNKRFNITEIGSAN